MRVSFHCCTLLYVETNGGQYPLQITCGFIYGSKFGIYTAPVPIEMRPSVCLVYIHCAPIFGKYNTLRQIKRKICGLLAANVIETVRKDVSFHYAFFYRRLDDGTMAGHGDGRKFLVIRGFVQLKSGRKIRMKHNFNGFTLLYL